jgi:hypothetical protein
MTLSEDREYQNEHSTPVEKGERRWRYSYM